jgi:branched-chain amino acid aminotransferase
VKVWLGSELVDEDDAQLSVRDHGLTVGDGVFETIKVVDGVPFALTRHLARLRSSGGRLGLAVPPDHQLRDAVDAILTANKDGDVGRLRITVTGGDGPPGTERGSNGPTLLVVTGPLRRWSESAVLTVVPWTRNERSAVAGAKTTSYAENVVALAHARSRGADEALFVDTRGHLCEGTGSNVFVVVNRVLRTPALSTGCLAGVTRALVVEWFGAEELELSASVLADAEEVFLTSTTRDIQPVRAVDQREYAAPGPMTAEIAAEFARRAATTADP